MKLYFAPQTRAVRIAWLLEELGLAYEIERVEFDPTTNRFFQQATPLGKLPTLEDGDVLMCESGAITEYILERYAEGRLAPAIGDPARAAYLQWLHFAEGTAFPPVGIVVWLARYRGEQDDPAVAQIIADARERAAAAFDFLERGLGAGPWVLGEAFSGADIMLGFTLVAGRIFGILDPARHPLTDAYLDRLTGRPAFKTAAAL